MSLTEEQFTKLVETACAKCGANELTLRAYVPARFTLLEGEAYGAPRFAYKGEELAKGTYKVECVSCKHLVHDDTTCAKCGAAGGVTRALEAPDAGASTRPKACPGCGDEQVGYVAWMPVVVKTHAARPEKPRTTTSLDDEGCHGAQIECKECLFTQAVAAPGACALCGATKG
jgi:hypothetical protein